MHAALAVWHREQQARIERLTALRDRFERAILAGCPEAVVNGIGAARLPHTSNIAFVGLERQALQMALDLAGVACSTGSACASGSTDVSPTLVAMGCEEQMLTSSLRFSLGAGTTAADVDQAAERILKICKELGNRFQGRKMSAAGRIGA
jgi:cysteine desulfurase